MRPSARQRQPKRPQPQPKLPKPNPTVHPGGHNAPVISSSSSSAATSSSVVLEGSPAVLVGQREGGEEVVERHAPDPVQLPLGKDPRGWRGRRRRWRRRRRRGREATCWARRRRRDVSIRQRSVDGEGGVGGGRDFLSIGLRPNLCKATPHGGVFAGDVPDFGGVGWWEVAERSCCCCCCC